MTPDEKVKHEADAQRLISLLESTDERVLLEVWIQLHPNRKHAIKRKLMPLAFK